MCEEMVKLREWLDDHEIHYEDDSDCLSQVYYIHRTKFFVNDNEFSVINGYGTYGGISAFNSVNAGLLECWVNCKGEPEGFLTAEDVIQKINDLLVSGSKGFITESD